MRPSINRSQKIIIINDLEEALYKSAELLCKLISHVSRFFSWLPCISIHMYHRKFASGISKIGRYIFLEILFWRRFFANGIHCVRGSHKLTVRVTMSRNYVSSSSAFFYWFFSPYEILWQLCFEQTMRCSQHHLFLSSLLEGILTLHACQSRTKS